MPKPIVCLAESLRQYLESFRDCFGKAQWKYFVTVLLGLIECEERHTLSALLRTVAQPVRLCGLSRFFRVGAWNPAKVAQRWWRRFCEQMTPLVGAEHRCQGALTSPCAGRFEATVVTGYLILDDSTHFKPKGRTMQGLGRHYSTTHGRTVPGHSLFQGLYGLLGRRCPLMPRLYRSQKVCLQEGVPFQSKIQMAVQTVETFEPVAQTQTHVLVDSWYHCQALRKAAEKRGFELSGGLKSNRKLRSADADGNPQWVTLSAYAATLAPTDWQEAEWPSQAGASRVWVHVVSTRVRKLGPAQVVLTKRRREGPLTSVRYWASSLREATLPRLLEVLAKRWSIEVFFEDVKDLLGSDHYQLMSAEGLVRWWTLIACLGCFLEEEKAVLTLLGIIRSSWGEVRRVLQEEHRQNLLHWIGECSQGGVPMETLGLI